MYIILIIEHNGDVSPDNYQYWRTQNTQILQLYVLHVMAPFLNRVVLFKVYLKICIR